MNKKGLFITGLILLIVGAIILIFGLYSLFTYELDFSSGIGQATGGIFSTFMGGVLVIIGGFMVYFSHIGKIAHYVAKETAPAVETTTEAVGTGLKKGFKKN